MKKKIPFIAIILLAFLVTVFNTAFSVYGSLFSDINELPVGNHISDIPSPDNNSVISVFKVENSLGSAIRCEYKSGDKKARNIFWQTDVEDVEIYWTDNEIVNINAVEIDAAKGGFYDSRRGVSLFQEGAIEGTENNE